MAGISRGELIGAKAKVVGSKNKSAIGLEGTIADETQNTLTLKTAGGMKKLLKEQVTLEISANGREVISGKALAKRPEDRIRMKIQQAAEEP